MDLAVSGGDILVGWARAATAIMIESLLDTDLYKLTMQAVVHKHFSDAKVEYLLSNRNPELTLSPEAVEWVRSQVTGWSKLKLTDDEYAFLKKEVPFLPTEYYEFLRKMRLNPADEIHIENNGSLRVTVTGSWEVAIWYEVPLLATVCEAYFKFVDTNWDMQGQHELAQSKAEALVQAKCTFSEFGTRRRRSGEVQRVVLEAISQAVGLNSAKPSPYFAGTSNVHWARNLGLKAVGTVAHELMMGVAAYMNDYRNANVKAMEVWLDTVGRDHTGVALTDTFGTHVFLRQFKQPFIDIYSGVRQDSGDPAEYTKLISDFYATQGVEPNSKRIVYSDALDVNKCISLRKIALRQGLIPVFGVGTCFTNDFKNKSTGAKSIPLNIVIKLSSVNSRPAVKLSDNIGKNMGDPAEVKRVKQELGYTETGELIDESTRWR